MQFEFTGLTYKRPGVVYYTTSDLVVTSKPVKTLKFKILEAEAPTFSCISTDLNLALIPELLVS